MTLHIGHIPYLHAEPFYIDMARRNLNLTELAPRAVASALANGEIDAGPVPLVDCFGLEDLLQPVAGFCLACIENAGSTLLFSTKPIEALAEAHIAITEDASTAPQLLNVLLRLKHQVYPVSYGTFAAAHDAFLLIGNQGLRQRMGVPDFPYTYDLGAEWHAWTGLPFVFARWMVRRDVSVKDLALIEEALYAGLEEGIDALCQVAEPRQDLVMLPRDIAAYIQGFRYFMGRSEQQAIERFRRYLEQLGSLRDAL